MLRLHQLYWVSAILLVSFSSAWGYELSPAAQRLSLWLHNAPLSPLLFLLAYLLAQQLFLSSTLFCVIGGALFGPLFGLLLNLIGAMTGAALSFLISRHLLATRVRRRLPPALFNLLEQVEREGWRAVLFLRLLPAFPYAMLNYALGLTKISLSAFLWPTLLCVGPRIAVYTYLGYTGREALEGRAGMVWHIILALGVLVALTWLPQLAARARLNRPAATAPSDSRDNPDGSPRR